MSYNPQSSTDRRVLADAILALMARSVFTEESRPGTREKVFAGRSRTPTARSAS